MVISETGMMRFCFALTCTTLITLFYWLLYDRPVIGLDDANIYFTYAKNLASGHGFVYYAGGEHVEGFTSFLWTLIVTFFYLISAEHFTILLLIFCMVLVSVTLTICLRFIRQLTHATAVISPQEVLFLVMIMVVPGYIDWTVLSLMETAMWSFFLVWITVRMASSAIFSTGDVYLNAALLALFVMLRPESLLWSFVFIGLTGLRYFLVSKNAVDALKRAMPLLLVVIVTIVALTTFRILYFGYPLPNTYYAKVSSDTGYNLLQGVKYLVQCCIQSPLLLLVITALLVSIALLGLKFSRMLSTNFREELQDAEWVQFTLSVVIFISLAIPVYLGGDHFKLLRFLQPFFPVYYLLFFNRTFWKSLVEVQLNHRPVNYFILIVLITPFIYMSSATPLHTYVKEEPPLEWEFELAEMGREDAQRMQAMFGPLGELPSVGVSAAGGFGYAYEGVVYDLMGLNNEQMAHASGLKVGIKNHAAFGREVFFQMRPDVFHGYFKISRFVNSPEDRDLLENKPDFEKAFVSRMYKHLFSDPQFIESYRPVIIMYDSLYLKTYVNVEFMEKLKSNAYHVIELPRSTSRNEGARMLTSEF